MGQIAHHLYDLQELAKGTRQGGRVNYLLARHCQRMIKKISREAYMAQEARNPDPSRLALATIDYDDVARYARHVP